MTIILQFGVSSIYISVSKYFSLCLSAFVIPGKCDCVPCCVKCACVFDEKGVGWGSLYCFCNFKK